MEILLTVSIVAYIAIGIIVYGWLVGDMSEAMELAFMTFGVIIFIAVSLWPVFVLAHIGARLARPRADADGDAGEGRGK